MRLPGTRYQEHGWEHVRKLLGRCSLAVLIRQEIGTLPGTPLDALLDPLRRSEALDAYLEAMALQLRAPRHQAQAAMPGNSYGDTAGELACALLFELRVQPACWDGFCRAIAAEHARHGACWQWQGEAGHAMLRKKANDLYAVLRDKADADACQVASGRPCTPNRMYTYRMLDTAFGEIARLFANWRHCSAQVADILEVDPGMVAGGMPAAARQMQSIADCRAEWVIRWSATLERHTGAPGPLHTKSKRFASLKNQPQAIATMLQEIGDYEALSANQGALGQVRGDEGEAALWLEDYWRVVAESEALYGDGGDHGDGALAPLAPLESLEAPEPDLLDALLAPPDGGLTHDGDDGEGDGDDDAVGELAAADIGVEEAAGEAFFLSPRFVDQAEQAAAGQVTAILAGVSLPVRLAVYHTLLGSRDDSYPDAWLDPATGELPPLRQLAALDGISMPTLRKRRNEAMARLQHVAAAGKGQR
ncbi:MAG: hypothetical protein K2X55_03630 [Burkholderiaceae bacterium]|nr:hypothetical protein [Burkholderiaceae bacterium]